MKRKVSIFLTIFIGLVLPALVILSLNFNSIFETSLGFINTKGEEVIDLEKYCQPIWKMALHQWNKDVAIELWDFRDGFAPVRFSDNWTFLDKTGQLFPRRFTLVREFSEQLAAVVPDDTNKFGFIRTDGTFAIYPTFESCDDFSEGLAAVKTHGKWGYIDRFGNWTVKPEYQQAMRFSQGLAAVQRTKDGKFGYIDRSGRIRVETKYDQVYAFSEGLAAVENKSRDASGSEQIVRGYIDRTGTVKFRVIEPLTTVNKLRDLGILTMEGLNTPDHPSFHNGLAPYQSGDKFGYIGKSGEVRIPARFDYVFGFREGYAVVYQNPGGRFGRFGYINTKGEAITETRFSDAQSFSGGLACVREPLLGRYGYIGPAGEFKIQPWFTDAGTFHEGFARVGHETIWP